MKSAGRLWVRLDNPSDRTIILICALSLVAIIGLGIAMAAGNL